jgi:hypothetical protein
MHMGTSHHNACVARLVAAFCVPAVHVLRAAVNPISMSGSNSTGGSIMWALKFMLGCQVADTDDVSDNLGN